jgi:hypothetical protein
MSAYHDAAPFPFELIHMLDRDRHDGHVTYNYPLECGRNAFIVGHLREALEAAQRLPAKHCKKALSSAAEFAIRHHDISEEIKRQWSAHVNELTARYDARRAAEARALEEA